MSSSSQTWQDIRVTSSLHPQKSCCRAPRFRLLIILEASGSGDYEV